METTCSISGCSEPARRRGWCQMHYGRWYRTGDPLTVNKRGRKQKQLNGESGWCRDEDGGWWYVDARQRYRGEERTCQVCGNTFPFRTAFAKHQPGLYCSRSCSNKAEKPGRKIPRSGSRYRYINSNGYVVLYEPHSDGNRRRIVEHRKVMSEHLGRPLEPNETVHHKNGIKDDNRLENLELWIGQHGRGQSVADRVADARAFLAKYEGLVD